MSAYYHTASSLWLCDIHILKVCIIVNFTFQRTKRIMFGDEKQYRFKMQLRAINLSLGTATSCSTGLCAATNGGVLTYIGSPE